MASINKAILIGNLGKDPEKKYTASGKAVANFNIATSESWKDKNTGEPREQTEWHRIVAWGKLGEICGQYLAKGRQVYVEGRIQTREWQDQQGNRRWTTEINATSVKFLGNNETGQRYQAPAQARQPENQGQVPPGDDEDIPF